MTDIIIGTLCITGWHGVTFMSDILCGWQDDIDIFEILGTTWWHDGIDIIDICIEWYEMTLILILHSWVIQDDNNILTFAFGVVIQGDIDIIDLCIVGQCEMTLISLTFFAFWGDPWLTAVWAKWGDIDSWLVHCWNIKGDWHWYHPGWHEMTCTVDKCFCWLTAAEVDGVEVVCSAEWSVCWTCGRRTPCFPWKSSSPCWTWPLTPPALTLCWLVRTPPLTADHDTVLNTHFNFRINLMSNEIKWLCAKWIRLVFVQA